MASPFRKEGFAAQTENQKQISHGLQSMGRNANMATLIGGMFPQGQVLAPDLSAIPDGLLTAASPKALDLASIKYTSLDPSGTAASNCRTFSNLAGLRQLQQDQEDNSYWEPGCGWIYKTNGSGQNPVISRGALGTNAGPTLGYPGSPDYIVGGADWKWDLKQAEKDITTSLIGGSTQCASIQTLNTQNPNSFGYCTTSGKIIPVANSTTGFIAKFPTDPNMGCLPADIITDHTKCKSDGFMNFTGIPSHGRRGATFSEGFEINYTSPTDFLNSCVSPLSRSCVVNAIRQAGCSDDGSLIAAINETKGTQNYDATLSNNMAFNKYQAAANPGITPQTIRDGSVSLTTAISDFTSLANAASSNSNTNIRLAARDLCHERGLIDSYDFCAEIRDDTIINESNISCLPGNPSLKHWKGKRYQKYIQSIQPKAEGFTHFNGSTDLAAFFGVESAPQRINLPNGTETVWIDTMDSESLKTPIIVSCDISNREMLPLIVSGRDLAMRNLSRTAMAFTSAFELRPQTDMKIQFQTTAQGAFMFGVNQNPFEGTREASNDWGSWRHQEELTYTSPEYVIRKDQKNTVVLKWFEGYAGSHGTNILVNGRPGSVAPMMYLTQEPLAPWMQYEICNRPNSGSVSKDYSSVLGPSRHAINQSAPFQSASTRYGFYEKRWNGPSGFIQSSGQTIPMFDTVSSGVVIQTDSRYRQTIPGKKGCISFSGMASWRTASYFAFSAFRTVTLLLRPAVPDGPDTQVFSHIDPSYRVGLSLCLKRDGKGAVLTTGRASVPVTPRVWNLVVLQYIADYEGKGIAGFSIHCQSLDALTNAVNRREFLADLVAKQTASGPTAIMPVIPTNKSGAGCLTLGANQQLKSFVGDVAWIHGFRTYINTPDMLQAELRQSWVSRWPRGEE